MRIILIHIGDIIYCPPAINVTQGLLDLGHEVIICTTKSKRNIKSKFDGVEFNYIDVDYELKANKVNKLFRLITIRKELWKLIDKYYNDDSLIWVVSDISIKHLGHKLINKKYILHLMELSERLTYYHKIKFLKLNSELLGNNAFRVIVPEYNRAHITKAWWNLNTLPFVIENKPYIKREFEKNCIITSSVYANKILSEIKGRKIILYQGIIHKERPLDEFIKAVDLLGDDYAFVLMSKGEDVYNHIGSKNYYFIPFVEPPYHLEITSHAYIGILSYFPVKSDYSILNAIFCAPNKTYEYGMFGVPMISNDVPSLKYLFNIFNCGICVEDFNKDQIKETILKIESNYDEISRNVKTFYDSVDIKNRLSEVLKWG